MGEAGRRGRRLAGATLFVTCMAVCLVPMGCGATDEYAAVPEYRAEGSLPASTVRALQACAEERAGRLQRRAYEIEFQVELKGDRVRGVTPKGPRLDDAGLEQCMMDALRGMADAGYAPDPDELISRGGLLPTRGLLANTSVLPEMTRLIPVVVGSSGTLIVVVVAVLVVAAVVSLSKDEPTEEECKEEWDRALANCDKWLSLPNPPRALTGGYKDRYNCAKGHVMEGCKDANEVDWGSKGRPGRRY